MTFFSKVIAGCALLILLGIGILSYRSTIRDEVDRGWVTHTHIVLETLQEVLTDVTQAETGQRGYILTGEEKYLDLYKAGLDQMRREMKQLRKLTADNPRQQDAITLLEQTVDKRLAALAER